MNCIFCNEEKINKEVVESTENFLLLPALGSFVPYYFLIISKVHADSIGSTLTNNSILEEFKKLKSKTEKFISEKTGVDYVCFEHGGAYSNTSGCCVGHAHLHVLPSGPENFLKNIQEKLGDPKSIDYENIHKKEDSGYLLLEEKNKIYYWPNPKIISQFMRRLVAQQCHIGDKYDWKNFPFYENMEKTTRAWKEYNHQ
ncbi:MAG: hypothetical protein HY979_03545 [Candidatus Magasanikbacteria bacterium]|nr:hypothetical protein [Candidatus Magasanikbacteria bacterium]